MGATRKQRQKQYIGIGILVLATHWILLYFSYILTQDTSTVSFWSAVYGRFEQAGDIPHYIQIAKSWYHATGEYANEIVFFPLYPMLMKAFQLVFRNYVVAGLVVSNLCLVVGSIFFYKLLDFEFDKERAWEGVILLTIYPVGVFMIGAYTESLFIMLTVMCLYYIRREKWLLVGILGMLAALSRSQGIILLVPAVYEVCILFRQKEKRRAGVLWTLLIPLGTLIYLMMNQVIYGHWNAFLEFQAAEPWYNTSHWISENLTQHFNMAVQYPYLGVIIYWAQILLYFAAMILLFYGLKKKIRTSYIAYGGAYIMMSYLHGWLISGPRYVMSCIPLYIILAGVENKTLKRIVLIISSVFALIFTMWYLQGQAIM